MGLPRGAIAVALLLGAALHCSHDGGHTSGAAGALDGTVAGDNPPPTPVSALYRPAIPLAFPTIWITDYAFACEDEIAGQWVEGSHNLEIRIVGSTPNPQGAQVPFPTGTFVVGNYAPMLSATVSYVALDATCRAPTDYEPLAMSGSLTVAMNDAGELTGTLDVTFTNNDHLTGHFTAQQCSALQQHSEGYDPPACGPAIVCSTPDAGTVPDASTADGAAPVPIQVCH